MQRLTQALAQQVEGWRMQPVVTALMTLRGLDLVGATTVVAELGDLKRFVHPRALMGYLGLVPSEYSTGSKRSQGAITKTGNSHVRRVLVEAAWNYRHPARLSPSQQRRQEGQWGVAASRGVWPGAVGEATRTFHAEVKSASAFRR